MVKYIFNVYYSLKIVIILLILLIYFSISLIKYLLKKHLKVQIIPTKNNIKNI